MLFDCHMHCERSCDSKMTLAQAVQRGWDENMGICITEHWDYDYPTHGDAFHFDLPSYKLAMEKIRSDRVLMGIEIGMQPHVADLNLILSQILDYDFVLCSIHCVRRKDLYEQDCYIGFTKKQMVQNYLADMLTCLQSHPVIDSLGHIDYITRYWPYGEQLSLGDAPEQWEAVLQELVRRDIPMEINTRQTDKPEVLASLQEIYGRYRELGGKYVTLGSDAHYDYNVCKRIREAYDFALDLGLQPVYYRKRQRLVMSL